MTMDRTLKLHGGLAGRRSVMTRAERIAHMIEEGSFDPEEDSPLGLPKTRVRASRAGKKRKTEQPEEAAEAAEGAEGAAGEGGEAPAEAEE